MVLVLVLVPADLQVYCDSLTVSLCRSLKVRPVPLTDGFITSRVFRFSLEHVSFLDFFVFESQKWKKGRKRRSLE